MSIPSNVRKIKEVFSVEQANAHLAEGWILVAIVPRGGGMAPTYTMGWTGMDERERTRQAKLDRARGLSPQGSVAPAND